MLMEFVSHLSKVFLCVHVDNEICIDLQYKKGAKHATYLRTNLPQGQKSRNLPPIKEFNYQDDLRTNLLQEGQYDIILEMMKKKAFDQANSKFNNSRLQGRILLFKPRRLDQI